MISFFMIAAGLCAYSEAFLVSDFSKTTTYAKNEFFTARAHANAKSGAESDKPTQEWDAERYRDQHSFVWKYGASLVDILQPKPGERILDIGCGGGELTASIAEAGVSSSSDKAINRIEAVGFDSDPNMVEMAQDQFPHLTFFQGDARNFEVDEPFDAIFSNAALHWVPPVDAERSVQAISKALKVGGRFVVEFGGKGNVQQIVHAARKVVPGMESPWYFPSIAEYSNLLEKHGIEVVSATLFDRPTPLEYGHAGLRNWMGCFGDAFFKGKSKEEVDLALGQMEEMLGPEMYNKEQDLWTADYRRIRIVGNRIPTLAE